MTTFFRPLQRQAARQLARSTLPVCSRRGYAVASEPFDWKDPLKANKMFTEDELAIAETAESYCQERMLPRVLGKKLIDVIPSYIGD